MLLSPGLPGRYPDLGGKPEGALGAALACGALVILWRTFSGPRDAKDATWFSVMLGKGRRGLIAGAATSLVLQVVLPLMLLGIVCQQRVLALFTPFCGLTESAVTALVCVAAMVVLPLKQDPEVGLSLPV